jgi:hypothetical protein
MTRRSLVAVFALFAVSPGAGLRAGPQVSQPTAPDLILVVGRVYTLDVARPWAEARRPPRRSHHRRGHVRGDAS